MYPFDSLSCFRKILQQTVNYIKSGKAPNFSVKGGPLEPNNAQILFAGFYCLLTRALRQGDHMPKPAFERDLQELNLSKEVLLFGIITWAQYYVKQLVISCLKFTLNWQMALLTPTFTTLQVIGDLCMLVYSETLHQSPTSTTLPHITGESLRTTSAATASLQHHCSPNDALVQTTISQILIGG